MDALLNFTLADLLVGGTGVIFLLSIFVEITPIKINPVSAFLKWMGKKINGDVVQEVTALKKQIVEIKDTNDERDAINCRVRILRFGDELRRGIRHSQESYDQVLSDIDHYETYCGAHKDFKNNKTVVTASNIKFAYSQRLHDNNFL